MKPYITSFPVVVVDMQTAMRALTAEDFDTLLYAWWGALHETYKRGLVGNSVDLEDKLMYVTFKLGKEAHQFQLTAQDSLDHGLAFFMLPREKPLSVDEQLDTWLGPDGIDPSDPSLPE